MRANPSHSDPDDRHAEDLDPAWSLLGRSPRSQPDAWFTVRTLARCRLAGPESPRLLVLDRVWRWALGSGLGLCLAMILIMRAHPGAHLGVAPSNQKGVQEAFEIMASINPDPDSPSPSSDNPSWQE